MIRGTQPRAQFTYRRRLGAGASGLATTALSSGISAGVSIATDALNLWLGSIQTSHNADTATTLIVNGLAQQLGNLTAAYLAEPNVTCADQRAALDAYDAAWLWLQSPQGCGAPAYGSAGNRCISDRAPGGKFPWQSYYRDPIANDPRLAGQSCDTGQTVLLPSLTTGTYQNTGVTSTGGSSTTGQPLTATTTTPAAAAPSISTAPAATVAGIPTTYLYVGGAALLVLLMVKK